MRELQAHSVTDSAVSCSPQMEARRGDPHSDQPRHSRSALRCKGPCSRCFGAPARAGPGPGGPGTPASPEKRRAEPRSHGAADVSGREKRLSASSNRHGGCSALRSPLSALRSAQGSKAAWRPWCTSLCSRGVWVTRPNVGSPKRGNQRPLDVKLCDDLVLSFFASTVSMAGWPFFTCIPLLVFPVPGYPCSRTSKSWLVSVMFIEFGKRWSCHDLFFALLALTLGQCGRRCLAATTTLYHA